MKAVSFGEVLWDIIEGKEYLGGAPFNLAAHLSKLGCSVSMISRVGNDRRGKKVIQKMKALGVESSFVQVDTRYPTGTVDVKLSKDGKPTFTINENVSYDFIEPQKNLLEKMKEESFDAFCFGTLAQRNEISRKTLYLLLEIVKSRYFFYDVNLRQLFYSKEIVVKSLSFSDIVKLNNEESILLSRLLFKRELKEEEFAKNVCSNFQVRIVCITRGENGCAIFYEGRFREIPGIKVKVIDTVGAGDAFSAGFLFKFCTGKDPFESAIFANRIGAFVASRRGAIPEYDDKIKRLIE